MELDNLPTHELVAAANAEAATFTLPKNWREGRGTSHGFAVDAASSKDIDDAIALSEIGESCTLHVSVADTGAFIDWQSALGRLARRRAWTQYKGTQVAVPMLPREVSEGKLSLLNGRERPVITVHVPINPHGTIGNAHISRDIIRARRITYAEAENLADSATETGVVLRGLEQVARLLFAARHRNDIDPEDAALEDEEGHIVAVTSDYATGRLIVQESMIAANMAMAHFMVAHGIPALYRNHVVPEDMLPELVDPLERAQLLGPLARAFYGPRPQGHSALNVPSYLHFTSPIRRFPDFANHANVAAYLDGREYPYPEDRLERIAKRLQMLALKEARQTSPRAPREPASKAPTISPYRKADYLLKKFADGSAGPGELATVLFNMVGTDDQTQAARIAAAQFAGANIHHARPALNVAIARGLVKLRAPLPGETTSNAKWLLDDGKGNTYPYHLDKNRVATAVVSARLISKICGVAVDPTVPPNQTREERILRDGTSYLRRLASENRLNLSIQVNEQADGGIRVGVLVSISGARHSVAVVAASKKSALRAASAALIRDLDLIAHPPTIQPKLQPESTRQQFGRKDNPLLLLHARQHLAGEPLPAYTFSDATDGRRFICTGTVTIGDEVYQITGEGVSKKVAQQQAAAALLHQLPRKPMNKKEAANWPLSLDPTLFRQDSNVL